MTDAAAQRRIREYRLGRIRAELAARDAAGGVFVDAHNVRYATGSRNMQVWTMHRPARYVFVAAEGPVVMFEFQGCEHLLDGIEVIDEIRPATGWFYFTSGPRVGERSRLWAREIADLVVAHGGGNRRLAVDKLNPEGAHALAALGIEVVDGQEPAEQARVIKSPDEIAGMTRALHVCGLALGAVRDSLEPGITEIQAWSELNRVNGLHGGEYIETRLLSSGPRAIPWFRECSDRVIEPGDLVAVDADMIGPGGYFADISRTFVAGGEQPTGEQKTLYLLAMEQIAHNMELLRPGLRFSEFVERAWKMPDLYLPNRYGAMVHGAGLCGEYPYIAYPEDFAARGYDGVFEENMTLCVESYMGADGGDQGVKLEQLVQITANGAVPLSDFPLTENL
jgi:Xaa-Pro aminopeptidase